MAKDRARWIDFMRGLGMLLVIAGHCRIPMPWFQMIYMFHMPLFYVISGYCHAWGKYGSYSLRQFLAKAFRTYLAPYLLFSALGLAITLLFPGVYAAEGISGEVVRRYLFGIFFARGYSLYTGEWGSVWFLVSQFWVVLLAFLSDKLRKPLLTAVAGLALLMLNAYFKTHSLFTAPGWLPFNLGAAFTAFPLFCAGMLLRQQAEPLIERETNTWIRLLFYAAIIATGFVVGSTNYSLIGFSENFYGNVCVMYASSLAIITGLFGLAQMLYRATDGFIALRPIEWVGRRTIPFLGIHGLVIPLTKLLLARAGLGDSWILTCIPTIAIVSLLTLLYDRTVGRLRSK